MLQHATLEAPRDRWNDCIAFWGLLGFAPMQPPESLRGRFTWVAREGTQIHLAHVETPAVAEVGHVAVLVPDYAGTVGALRQGGTRSTRARTPGTRSACSCAILWVT